MLGLLVGAAALFGMVRVARYGGGCGASPWGGWGRGRWGRWGHHHPGGHGGFGHGHFGGHGGWEGFRTGARGPLRFVFERLSTSPGQEKVIVQAVDAVREAAQKARGELSQSRSELARALRQEHFDKAQVKETFARHDALLTDLRETVLAELSRVHEALDDRQRRELADFLEGGFGGRGGHGPWGERYI